MHQSEPEVGGGREGQTPERGPREAKRQVALRRPQKNLPLC